MTRPMTTFHYITDLILVSVIFVQGVSLQYSLEVRPKEVLLEVERLANSVEGQAKVILHQIEDIHQTLDLRGQWMSDADRKIEENTKDRFYRYQMKKLLLMLKEENPQLDIPTLEQLEVEALKMRVKEQENELIEKRAENPDFCPTEESRAKTSALIQDVSKQGLESQNMPYQSSYKLVSTQEK